MIDKEILFDLLGLTRVSLPRFNDNKHAVDIKLWLENNCAGKYMVNVTDFIFEHEQDAVQFALRWS